MVSFKIGLCAYSTSNKIDDAFMIDLRTKMPPKIHSYSLPKLFQSVSQGALNEDSGSKLKKEAVESNGAGMSKREVALSAHGG